MSALALEGGSWRPMRGTLAWVEGVSDAELRELWTNLRKPRPKAVPPPNLIACRCGARLTEMCKTSGGNPTMHAYRLVSRRCPCGGLLAPRKQMCEPCRLLARKRTYTLREIRKATATRRRSETPKPLVLSGIRPVESPVSGVISGKLGSAPEGACDTASGADQRIYSTEPRSEG